MLFEDYIMNAPEKAQKDLIGIIETVDGFFPHCEKRLYHGIPTFFHEGIDIINIGAYKKHFSLYVGREILGYLKEKYPEREFTKTAAAIVFPYSQKFPYEILDDICNHIKLK